MRFAFAAALALSASALRAEYREIEIVFAPKTDCVSCVESMEGRLARVRGVERAELDLAASCIRLTLAAGNVVRTAPLRARISQDGTAIVEMRVAVEGFAAKGADGWTFAISGIDEVLPMSFDKGAGAPPAGGLAARGRVVETDSGELAFQAESFAHAAGR
jgi:hypothetical protein